MAETLQEHLTNGGYLNFEVHRELIDATMSPMTPDERADRAATARYDAETLADGGDPLPGRHLTAEQRVEVTQAKRFLADYLEDTDNSELERAVQAALPEPLMMHLEAQVHPHRLRVGSPEGYTYWSCDNCGATFPCDEAEALLITDRPGHSSLHRDIVICASCVTDAAALLSASN